MIKKKPPKPKNPDPPDYECNHSRRGGYISELKEPHHRWFPHGRQKREVTVTISTYQGMCPGAKHYYISLREEDNPIWDGFNHQWTMFWDDKIGEGRKLETKKNSEEEARAWALKTFQEEFNPKTHKLASEYGRYKPKWMYLREGD